MHIGTDIRPFDSFQEASAAILDHLHEILGFDLWMVTRTEGEDWIVLHTNDRGYSVNPGDLFRWTDSFCSRMVLGKGPRIAPASDDVDAAIVEGLEAGGGVLCEDC